MRRIQTTSHRYPTLIKRFFIIITVIGIFLYIVFKLQNLVTGPEITIDNPKPGRAADNLITVTGTAERAEELKINGNMVFMNETDEFSVPLLLMPGYNIITVQATDRFGKETTKQIEVVGVPRD